MVRGFGDVSFGLEVGEFGIADFDPQASPYGWHVIKRSNSQGMLQLGPLRVDPPWFSPNGGVTDVSSGGSSGEIGGAGLVSMEFVSSEALTRGVRSAVSQMAFTQQERPIGDPDLWLPTRGGCGRAASVERARTCATSTWDAPRTRS